MGISQPANLIKTNLEYIKQTDQLPGIASILIYAYRFKLTLTPHHMNCPGKNIARFLGSVEFTY